MDETDPRLICAGYWDDDLNYPTEDWKDEVMAGDTRLGYLEWVEHRRESEKDDN